MGLDALNFFLADVRDGLGPYLAVYLIASQPDSHEWDEASAGAAMTIAGLVGLVAQTPAGKWIDASRHKRALVILAAVAVTVTCVLLPWLHSFGAVVATQSLAAAAATVFPPAIAAITLGVVGSRAFTRRVGRNEGFNHLGNAVSASLAGLLALRFGAVAVFWLMGALAASSILATLLIPAHAIDDRMARGMEHHEVGAAPNSLSQTLRARPALAWFSVAVALFHLANAAMLTSVGQQLARIGGKEHATELLSLCVVVAQVVMVPVAIVAGRAADRFGRKPVFLFGFGVLALRGFLYPLHDSPSWLVTVQCLDGIGAGIFGVLFPVVIADLTRGTGQFNASQGVAATAQGIGAALSASIAGIVIVNHGYGSAFIVLGIIALVGFATFAWKVPETRCAL